MQESFEQVSKQFKVSLWSGDTGLSSNKKNSFALVKKSNIGVKINAKPLQNKISAPEGAIITDKEAVSRPNEAQSISTSTSDTSTSDTGTKSSNVSNSLSLLGAYSDSSDNDSN